MKRLLRYAVLMLTLLASWATAQTQQPTQALASATAPPATAVGQSSTQPEHPTLNLWFNGMTALGTLGASILALFGPRIRAWLMSPVLAFRVNPKSSPHIEQLTRDDSKSSAGKKNYYEIRVEISNSGKDAARNCRARVNAVYKRKAGTSDYYAAKLFVPKYLCWAKDDTKSDESLDVLPHLPEYIIIGRLTTQESPMTGADPSTGDSTNPFGIEIAVEPEGAKGRFCFLGEGTVVLPFLVYADNLRTYEQKYVEIFWDGKSAKDFGSEHFNVKLLSKEDGDTLVKGAQ